MGIKAQPTLETTHNTIQFLQFVPHTVLVLKAKSGGNNPPPHTVWIGLRPYTISAFGEARHLYQSKNEDFKMTQAKNVQFQSSIKLWAIGLSFEARIS